MVVEAIPFNFPQVGRMEVHENRGQVLTVEFTYPNGYGASVIRRDTDGFGGSYGASRGLFELAVLVNGAVTNVPQIIGSDNPDKSVGWLDADEVDALLTRIANLPQR